jgi:hypothetical protein
LFTGHMVDKPGREHPRFPPSNEQAVTKIIDDIIEQEKSKRQGDILGIAGGACGGDIIFHEVCRKHGIKSQLYLALPRDQFIFESVQFAGIRWVERFDQLFDSGLPKVLSGLKELPVWLRKKKNYSIWERNNLWMLNAAMVHGGSAVTLIALWDGKKGDSEGGTEHMVNESLKRGAKVIVIDPLTLQIL